MKTFVIGLFAICVPLIVCIVIIIVTKKTIYYQKVDKSKRITAFDYFSDFDGSWLFKTMGYKKILLSNPNDTKLKSNIDMIRLLELVSIILAILLIIFLILMKFLYKI